MIRVIPILEVTMGLRGNKQHDMDTLYEELIKYDTPVFIVDGGVIKYKNPHNMGASIIGGMKKRNLMVSYRPIKNETNRIMIFKI